MRKFFGNQKGWTLIELMIVVGIMGLVTPAITLLFLKVTQGYAADEMRIQLTQSNQLILSRLQVRLEENKHMFMGGPSLGASFVSAVSFVSAPATVAGTTLAQAQTSVSGSLDASVSDFEPANIGNSLFFAAYDTPQTFYSGGTITIKNAPLTVFGAGVTNSNGTSVTLIVDLYRFYYYYLSTSPHPFPASEGATALSLVEWQSAQYPDYSELSSISDNALQNNAVSWVLSKGLTTVWDSDQQAATLAFFNMNYNVHVTSSPATFQQVTHPSITQASVTYLCKIPNGIISRGFSYGTSPNSAGWKNAPIKVPIYGTASGLFPGGFEIGISGSATGRNILIRSVLAAKGAAPRAVGNDISIIQSIRDVW